MQITFTSTKANVLIGRFSWPNVGSTVTVDTAVFTDADRTHFENAIIRGDLTADVRFIRNSIRATESDASEDSIGSELRYNPTTKALLAESAAASRQAASNGHKWMIFAPAAGNVPDLNTASVGFTHHAMVELPDAFDLVRIVLHNFDIANTLTITSVSVAVGDGSSVENSGATYSVVLPAPIVIPAARSINGRVYPSIARTNSVYLPSVARASGSGALVFVRIYTAAGSTPNISVWQTGGNTGSGWEAAGSRVVAARYQSGDFTSTNQAGFTATTVRAFTPVFAVEYVTRTGNGTSVLTIGDSITNAGLVTNKGWSYQAVQTLRAGGRVVDYANYGVSGATADEFLANAQYLIPILRPKVVMVPCWTPNSGPDNIAVVRAAFIGIRDLCAQYGAQFVAWNGTPRSQSASTTPFYTADQDATRRAWLTEAAGLVDVMIDTNSSVATTGTPQAYANASYTQDGLHPSSAGYGLMAGSVTRTLPAYL